MNLKEKERSSRACLACKRRKVKCNGEQDCDQCKRLSLVCTFPEVSSNLRSRRTAVRGRVIKSCSASQDSSPPSISSSLKYSHFSAEFFLSLVSDYSTYVLPTFPIISAPAFIAAIDRMHENKNDYALVCSLAALTRNVTNENSSDSPGHIAEVRALCLETLHARGFLWASNDIAISSIMTSVILAKCVSDIEHDGGAGYCYLRESISKLQVLRIDDPDNLVQCSPEEVKLRERLYWLLFIHERFDNINKGRPAVLRPLAKLPEYDDSMPDTVNQGFNHLIQLFCMVDADFVKHWSNKPSPSMTLEWVQEKQSEIGNNMQIWEEEIGHLSVLQQVDLTVTHYWLRALVWQMALEKFLLSPEGHIEDDHMSILYPVQLSGNLRSLLSDIPREAVEVHSTGILCKMFEITATASDILEHVIARLHEYDRQTRHLDDFMFLLEFLLSMPRLPCGFRSLLVSKFHKISSLFQWYSSRNTDALVTKLAISPHNHTWADSPRSDARIDDVRSRASC